METSWKKWIQKFEDLLSSRAREIRVMTQSDVKEVVRIIRLHDTDDAKAAQAYFDAIPRMMRPCEDECHFVIRSLKENRIIGVSGYGRDDSLETRDVFWLGWTYVNPFYRGQGYGKDLLQYVLNRLEALGARKLFADTSSLQSFESAIRFYQSMGFEIEGRLRDYYRPGEDKIFLGYEF